MEASLRSLLDWYAAMGVDVPDIAPAKTAHAKKKRPQQVKSQIKSQAKPQIKSQAQIATPTPTTGKAATPQSPAQTQKAQSLEELRLMMNGFDAGLLSDRARQAVFARGNPQADLMVIGEAPTRDDDIAGQPFMGGDGALLNRMLGAIGLGEDDFYVTYFVNWRPPQDRPPSEAEIELCRPFLTRHIELAQPKILLLVGGMSMQALTGLSGILKNHGQWQDVSIGQQLYPSMAIYPPALLLRRPELKKDAWRDLLALREKLDPKT